ncbi:Na+/H+ antiporter NhaA [Actinomycetaceae bacterium L2_0104]
MAITRVEMAGSMKLIGRYRRALQNESFAGMLLVVGALIALFWANSPVRESYFTIANTVVGPHALHLDLTIADWAADGLLTLFFFVVGLELKQEFTTGSLHDPRKAAVPIIAAVCGMAGPIGVYVVVQLITGSAEYGGWAIPVATDIAFALAVLSIFGKGLPAAARTFLMTLAVADDLGGIIVIAIFFSSGIDFLWLAISIACILLFGFLTKKRIIKWWLLWPVGILAWYFMHGSGIHATIAGVALGMMVPARAASGEKESVAHRLAHKMDFYSAGFVVPVFAFFAAGVNIIDSGGFLGMLGDPVAIGIYLGLPFGKLLGISGGVWILVRIFKLKLEEDISIADIVPISLVAGIGFTVSLLIAQLSFSPLDPHEAHARVAVILGSLLSVILGAITLRLRQASRLREIGE